ncbi:MAG: NADH-quinone oxidoreductase subunit D [Chloroflexota bacterium]|nr:NADH-quinone oxidoreductase subunit D [Chloroflexota bacterium]
MLKTETITLNLGPQHPSTHGVFRLKLKLDGELVHDLEPVMGYLHRGIEKLSEERTYVQVVPFTDRLDYICAMTNNQAYAIAVEKLANIEVPERAEYIRVIMAEFTRIINHMLAVGFLWNELGAYFTPLIYCYRERERILDLFEKTCGSRMSCNYMRPGGVSADLPDGFIPEAKKLNAHLEKFTDELDRMLSENEIFISRAVDIGVLTADDAINASITGPMLRASGVPYDIRKVDHYSIYDRFDFDVPTCKHGDVWDRYYQHILEIYQSIGIIDQALDSIPDGKVMNKSAARALRRPPEGEAYGRIESPKGELSFYAVSDGSKNPYRLRIRPPSMINLTALKKMCKGHKIQDVIVILGSINIVLGDVDR